MLVALLICSDGECDAVYEAWGDGRELAALACDCGCTLQVVRLTYSEEAADGCPRVELQFLEAA